MHFFSHVTRKWTNVGYILPYSSISHYIFITYYVFIPLCAIIYQYIYIYTFLIIVVYPFRQSQRSAGQEISRLQQQNSVQQQNQGRSSDELVFTILPTKNKYGGFHSHGVYNSEMISYHTNIGYIYNDWYKSPILARIWWYGGFHSHGGAPKIAGWWIILRENLHL